MRSYAQFETDLKLASFFPPDYVGTYVDVGAHHPTVGSNTYLFYERGWRGITVEPTQSNYRLHCEQRPGDFRWDCAISNREAGNVDFFEADESSVSTLDVDEASLRIQKGQGVSVRSVSTMTLRELFRIEGVTSVDILSIDVEGHERQVLEGCPFDEIRPWLIVLEACYPCTEIPCQHLWEDILTRFSYEYVATCGVNRIYRALYS